MAEEIRPTSTMEHNKTVGNDAQEVGMPLITHFQELRLRIIIVLITVAISASISWFYAGAVVDFIISPVGKLVFLTPRGGFLLLFEGVCFYGGAF